MEPPASAGGVREAAILGVATGTWAAGVTLCRNVGIACAAAAGLAVKYWSATTSLAVVRCGRDAHRRVWASMTMLRDVKGRAVVARVLHNASTLRSSRAATRSRVEAAFARLVARGGMPGGASAAAAGTEAAKVAIDAMCE